MKTLQSLTTLTMRALNRCAFQYAQAVALLFGVTCFLCHQSAHAITINDTAGTAAAIAEGSLDVFDPVVELDTGGGAICTATLIDPTHILTAQHCTIGKNPLGMRAFFHHLDNDGGSDGLSFISAKAEAPGFTGLASGSDVAVLTLRTPAPAGITPMSLFDGNPSDLVGLTATATGFGLNGLGSTGNGLSRDGLRWAGENVIDYYGEALGDGGVPFAPVSPSSNIFNADFDDGTPGNNAFSPGIASSAVPLPLEASTGPGDSGGPLLVNAFGGGLLIAGVVTGGIEPSAPYGNSNWWTSTASHKAFIQNAAPGATFVSVPEPSSITLIGIGFLLVLWRKSRRAAV